MVEGACMYTGRSPGNPQGFLISASLYRDYRLQWDYKIAAFLPMDDDGIHHETKYSRGSGRVEPFGEELWLC